MTWILHFLIPQLWSNVTRLTPGDDDLTVIVDPMPHLYTVPGHGEWRAVYFTPQLAWPGRLHWIWAKMSRSHPSEARWPQLQPPATRVKTNKRRPGRFFAPFTSDTININTWSVLCFDRSLFPSKVCVLSQNTLEYLLLVHPSLSVPGWPAPHRAGRRKERENDDQSRLVLSFTWSLDYEAAADLVWS